MSRGIDELKLETERLILRPPRREDFEGFAELQADEEAARFIGGAVTRPEAWRWFMWQPGSWWLDGFGMFAIIERASGEWLGQLGPWKPEGWPGNEVGWSLRRVAQGKGYALEAARPAIDWAFDNLGWTDIIHCIDAENVPSQKLAERLGSRKLRQTRLPPPFESIELDVWGQSRDAWRAGRGG